MKDGLPYPVHPIRSWPKQEEWHGTTSCVNYLKNWQKPYPALGVSDFTVEPETSKNKGGEQYELRADTHPSVIYVNYKSVIDETSEYLLPRVKIEISCLSMDEPVEEKTIRSFISEAIPEAEDVSVNFNTVIPTRTFLEKIFLLHEEFQKEKPRSYRYVTPPL